MVPNSRLDSTEAAVLFKVLDDTIGVFRFPEMSEEDWKYWAITRERFISTFTNLIPPTFWFQGGSIESCNLKMNGKGFNVTGVVSEAGDEKILEECNKQLSVLVFESLEIL